MTFLQTKSTGKNREEILFLILAVTLLYCRALWGTVISIDDAGIMKFYAGAHLTLADVLRPGAGYYYRPLISLSYYIDYHLLGQSPMLLHLENVLIHGANVLLVFVLSRRLFGATAPRLPILAALLFAAHPVNCEAVSWIAGRTDPLAALFVLLSSLSLCHALESAKRRYTVLSVLLLLAGVLAKETALLFVPASFLLVAVWCMTAPESNRETARAQAKLLLLLYVGVCLLFASVLIVRSGSHNSVAKLFAGHKGGAADALRLALAVFGFYVKKAFLPWPLNFAITKVSPWYCLPGAGALLFLCVARKRNPYFLLVAMGLLFLLPALVVAVCDVAWAVAAERYLYIPSAFLAVGVTGYLCDGAERLGRPRLAAAILLLCICAGALTTFEREGIWHSNLSLFRDTVAQTADFGMLHNELATALAREGKTAEARKELDVAASLPNSRLVDALIRKNRLLLELDGKTSAESRAIISAYGWDNVDKDADLLNLLRSSDYMILLSLKDKKERDAIVAELLKVSYRLYALTGNPVLLYNNGQLHLTRGERAEAASCFARCVATAPADAYYKAAAVKLAATVARTP